MLPGIMRGSRLAAALLTVALVSAGASAAETGHVDVPPDESFKEYVPGAERLEGRLLAPCCWDSSRQTLDIHGSPIANDLRREIRTRLRAGESPDAVEADLVKRYTTKILAVPPDNPLPSVGTFLAILMVGVGGGAAAMIARWRRRSTESGPQAPAAGTPAAAPDKWDARLDAELDEAD